MAEQPNISSILAALAAQRPAAPPSQNQQPVYQTQPSQQAMYPHGSGYSLPQPTTSGSVDLSNIKPVNSGMVSIGDAIAKAKAIAAKNGVSYDRAPVYGGGQESNNLYATRSRSRSPVRRDAFRDNFNPYRDERRGDRGPPSREYRERSYSPGPRAAARVAPDRQNRDGPQTGKSSSHQPALRDGEDTMQIMVPDRTVGLIIGRGGETIRDLQERSGCHVNIVGEQKSVNGLRPVNLIGSKEAATRAKDLIMEIVESDSKNAAGKGGSQVQRDVGHGSTGTAGDKDSIFVPSDAVGMIIGKGGETIKDMQTTTGCKINVSPSSGPGEVEREIGLVGTRDAIAAAKRAINDKVEAAQQKSGSRGRGQNDYGDRAYGQQQSYDTQQSQSSAQNAGGTTDPYAAYGGYEKYVQLWYQAVAAQSGQAPDASKPPGTS